MLTTTVVTVKTCAAGTISNFNDSTFGHVGAPVPSVEIKLVDVPDMNYFTTKDVPEAESKDASKPKYGGEVWIRGPSVALGYYKDEKKTKEDFDENGWFHTGSSDYLLFMN